MSGWPPSARGRAPGNPPPRLLDAVRLAKDDARIKVLFLDLDAMSARGRRSCATSAP
ncbi:MAG: hypothetical protein U0599_03825 [Vicinamibacteria bacterium]